MNRELRELLGKLDEIDVPHKRLKMWNFIKHNQKKSKDYAFIYENEWKDIMEDILTSIAAQFNRGASDDNK
jgi:hypothetical protein